MRIDKFIWCVRLAKTRSLASKLVAGEKVKLLDQFIKPKKEIEIGNQVSIKVNPIWRSYEILDIPKSRVGARLVEQYIREITPEEDLQLLAQTTLMNRQNHALGIKGRPSKKDRRDMDKLKGK